MSEQEFYEDEEQERTEEAPVQNNTAVVPSNNMGFPALLPGNNQSEPILSEWDFQIKKQKTQNAHNLEMAALQNSEAASNLAKVRASNTIHKMLDMPYPIVRVVVRKE